VQDDKTSTQTTEEVRIDIVTWADFARAANLLARVRTKQLARARDLLRLAQNSETRAEAICRNSAALRPTQKRLVRQFQEAEAHHRRKAADRRELARLLFASVCADE
jgi:hypothetical protein